MSAPIRCYVLLTPCSFPLKGTAACAAGTCCSCAAQTSTERPRRTRPERRVWPRSRSATSTTPFTPASTSGSRSTLTFSVEPPRRSRPSKCSPRRGQRRDLILAGSALQQLTFPYDYYTITQRRIYSNLGADSGVDVSPSRARILLYLISDYLTWLLECGLFHVVSLMYVCNNSKQKHSKPTFFHLRGLKGSESQKTRVFVIWLFIDISSLRTVKLVGFKGQRRMTKPQVKYSASSG